MTTRSNAELADALDAHAVIHENEYQDDNQREWAKDLRDAAAALRAGVCKPTRYPWDQAPDWAMWAATDRCGDLWWYQSLPVVSESLRLWDSADDGECYGGFMQANYKDWRNSLEKRPEKA